MLHREDIYTIGHPAMEGVYQPFIDFAMRESGKKIIDIGCGYGNYSKELMRLGKEVKGIEYNIDYVKKAKENGVDCAQGDAHKLKIKDSSFDTALLFEVLEHIPDPEKAIKEALRVADKVLVTVPNSSALKRLESVGLTYYHMITEDHINFFSESDFAEFAQKIGANIDIKPSEPTMLSSLVEDKSSILHRIIRRFERHGYQSPVSHYRLYCILTKS